MNRKIILFTEESFNLMRICEMLIREFEFAFSQIRLFLVA